jgi:hypothetical protein
MRFVPTENDSEEKRRATGMGNVPPPSDSSVGSAHAVLAMPTATEEDPDLFENVLARSGIATASDMTRSRSPLLNRPTAAPGSLRRACVDCGSGDVKGTTHCSEDTSGACADMSRKTLYAEFTRSMAAAQSCFAQLQRLDGLATRPSRNASIHSLPGRGSAERLIRSTGSTPAQRLASRHSAHRGTASSASTWMRGWTARWPWSAARSGQRR